MLLGALTMVLKDDMGPILPGIVKMMLDTLESLDGILVSNGHAVSYVISTCICLPFSSKCLTSCRNIVSCDYVSNSGAGRFLTS
jgi:hypothetical protein